MALEALFEHLVIDVVGRGHERDARHLQGIDALQYVIGQQGDVLDAFAVELHQELFDLPAGLARLFVERDADHAVGCGHRAASEARVGALDVEVTDLAEVENLLVKAAPKRHAAFVNVVREVVDDLEAVTRWVAVHPFDEFKVDVVDALAVFKAVDQIQRRTANALDGRQAQLHRASGHLHRLRAHLQRTFVRFVRVLHPKGQGTGTRPVLGRKVTGQAFGLAVDDEVDVALAVEHHIFGAVLGHQRKAHFFKQRLQQARHGRGELHKLETTQTHGVVKQISHEKTPVMARSTPSTGACSHQVFKKREGTASGCLFKRHRWGWRTSLERGRWRARLAPRAASEVDADDQDLDGHGAMVTV